MPNDFSVLKRAKIRRGELVPLQMRAEAMLGFGVRLGFGGGMMEDAASVS